MNMQAAHEQPSFGPAADFAASLRTQIPRIQTERLHLRAPELSDFDAWAEVLCGPSGPFLGGPFTRDEAFHEFLGAVAIWLLRGHGCWTVALRETGEVLGFVMIGFEAGDREPELGFLLRPAAEGKGYAYEAAVAARAQALGPMGLTSLVSYIAPDNTRSIRLARRLDAWVDGAVEGCLVYRHPNPKVLQ